MQPALADNLGRAKGINRKYNIEGTGHLEIDDQPAPFVAGGGDADRVGAVQDPQGGPGRLFALFLR